LGGERTLTYSHADPKDLIAELQDKIAEARPNHNDTMKQHDELRYELALAHLEHQDTAYKLLEKELQLFDLRKLVLRLSDRLIARERHRSTASLAGQLQETNRFISSIGGQLRDGVHATSEQHRRRSRVASEPIEWDV
jgi:hypothetical protein